MIKWNKFPDKIPDRNGLYLVVEKHSFGRDKPYVCVEYFAQRGADVDKDDENLRHKKNIFYSGNYDWGFYDLDNILYWAELPDPPVEEQSLSCILI